LFASQTKKLRANMALSAGGLDAHLTPQREQLPLAHQIRARAAAFPAAHNFPQKEERI
jgi:hypothetical protein